MSSHAERTLVAKLELNTNTYYVTDRTGIVLDGNTYLNVVTSWGNISYKAGQISNPDKAGGGFEVGDMSITMVNGEKYQDGGYVFDVTDIWNNHLVTAKRWTSGDANLADCEGLVKGLIKNFKMESGRIAFDVEVLTEKDDVLLPQIVCEDDSGNNSYESIIWSTSGNSLIVANPTLFSVGELILCVNDAGNREYNRVLTKNGATLGCMNTFNGSYTAAGGGYCRKLFRSIPKKSIGKTVPIQIGSLDDPTNGVFGKALTVDDSVGSQAILADDVELTSLSSLGVWDAGLERFFTALTELSYTKTQYTASTDVDVDVNRKEFVVNGFSNGVSFYVDSSATLAADIIDPLSDTENIEVDDATQLEWLRDQDYEQWTDAPLVLGANTIAIGREVMQMVDEPVLGSPNDSVYVERGLFGSTKTVHSSGDVIYHCATFASRNLLSFNEKFEATALSNFYYSFVGGHTLSDMIQHGTFNNIIDADNSTYIELLMTSAASTGVRVDTVGFDMIFPTITTDAVVMGCFPAVKTVATGDAGSSDDIYLYVCNPARDTSYDYDFPNNQTEATYVWMVGNLEAVANSFNNYDTIDRGQGCALIVGVGFRSNKFDISSTFKTLYYSGGYGTEVYLEYPGTSFSITKLTDLNKKWKWGLRTVIDDGLGTSYTVQVYNLALWVDFALNFTTTFTGMSLKGRPITSDVVDVNADSSPSLVGNVCENPLDVLVLLLIQELRYTSSDFSSNWATVWDYYNTSGNFTEGTIPVCAVSYGITDERRKGWELCEWLASHFNLLLFKNYDGNIDVVNLHEIYYNTPTGYEIHLDDILFLPQSGQRRFGLWQTGTDLIYNDVQVRWKRNNFTNEPQRVYTLPDSYTLLSGASLLGAREQYYRSGKRTLDLLSPFIYSEDDAARKAKWEADDKAEAHFYVEFVLDFDHWQDVAVSPAPSEQWKIGDVIYFRGQAEGVDFTETQDTSGGGKFYITETILADTGREIEIHAKSIQPVQAFVTTATSGEFIWDDTGGTSLSGDSIKDDTGGTGVSGDDIKDDTGG